MCEVPYLPHTPRHLETHRSRPLSVHCFLCIAPLIIRSGPARQESQNFPNLDFYHGPLEAQPNRSLVIIVLAEGLTPQTNVSLNLVTALHDTCRNRETRKLRTVARDCNTVQAFPTEDRRPSRKRLYPQLISHMRSCLSGSSCKRLSFKSDTSAGHSAQRTDAFCT